MNLDDLVNMVGSYTKRPDLSSETRTYFIPLAEARIGRDLKALENEMFAVVTPTTEDQGAELPADFATPIAIYSAGSNWPLGSTGPDSLKKWQSSGAIHPMYYYIGASKTVEGGKAIYTAPFKTNDLSVSYYARPELNDVNPTNPILTRYPQLYLYSTMLELHIWEKNPEALNTIQGSYQDEVGAINREAARSRGGKPAMEVV